MHVYVGTRMPVNMKANKYQHPHPHAHAHAHAHTTNLLEVELEERLEGLECIDGGGRDLGPDAIPRQQHHVVAVLRINDHRQLLSPSVNKFVLYCFHEERGNIHITPTSTVQFRRESSARKWYIFRTKYFFNWQSTS